MHRKETFLIITVILTGLALRIWGINFGLPFQLHQDEPIVINHAVGYGAGDFNPHFFIIPPFASYLVFFFYGLYFFLGKLLGYFIGVDDFALRFFTDPGSFYLIARIVLGTIPGILMIYFTFSLHKRLFGEKGALYAAMLCAFSFLAVTNSHYAYVDNLMIVLILAAYITFIRMTEVPSFKNYVISAILLGLAAGAKYNAALLAGTFYAAHIKIVKKHALTKRHLLFDKKLFSCVCLSLLTFFVVNPFSVLDWRSFSGTILGGIRSGYFGPFYHITYSAAQGIGWGLVVAAIAGFVAIIAGKSREKAVLFFSFPALFYVHLIFNSQRFSRYVLPLVPFFSIGASFFLFQFLFPRAKTIAPRIMIIAAALFLVVPTAVKSIKADLLFAGPDTRIISTKWLEENIPQGAKIAVDHTSFRPFILQTKEQLLEKQKIIGTQKGLAEEKEKKLAFLLRAIEGEKTYNVYFLSFKPEKSGQFLFTVPSISYDMQELKNEGIDYVIVNYNTMSAEKNNFLEKLERTADKIMEFSPYYDGQTRERFDKIDTTCVSIGTKELFSRRLMGPVLVIYRLRR